MLDKLRLDVLLTAADRVSEPLKRMSKEARALAGDVGTAETALQKLQSQQRALKTFQSATAQMRDTRVQLQTVRQSHAELAAQTHTDAAAQKAHTTQLAAADAAVKRLTASFDKQASAARRAKAVMQERGISNPATAEAQLAAAVTKTTQALEHKRAALQKMQALEAGRISGAMRGAMHGGMLSATGMGMMHTGRRVVQTAWTPVEAYMQHQDAMLGIARQVAGARDDKGKLTKVYRDAEKQVRELSTRLPQSTVEIAQMMTAAARMEVPTSGLASFVELASEMATAFDAVPDQLAESMGKVAKVFKWPVTEIRGLADSINYLDDNATAKGADIIDVLLRVSSTANVGISAQNAAAFGSTLLTLGERAETASTAINTIFSKFSAATKGTNKFKSAVDEIGMTPEQIQTGMAADATDTVLRVAQAINALPKENRIGVMVELVGLEHSDTLGKLVNNTEELRRQITMTNSAQAKGSMAREAAARNDTLRAKLQMQQNRAFNALAVAGETLEPHLLRLLKIVNPLLERIADWMQAHPRFVGGVLATVAALGALAAALGALAITAGAVLLKSMLFRLLLGRLQFSSLGLGGALARVVPWLQRAGQTLGAWGARLAWLGPWLLRIAGVLVRVMTGPIGWLITVATALYFFWDEVVTLLKGVVNMFVQAGLAIGNAVRSAAEFVFGMAGRMFEAGAAIGQGLANGIASRITAVRDAISMAAGDAVDYFKDKLAINSPSRVFMQLGSYVGEGAALGIQNGAAMVRSAALGLATATMLPMAAAGAPKAGAAMGAGSVYQITINAAPGMDGQAIARAVAAELDRRERDKDCRRYSALSDID